MKRIIFFVTVITALFITSCADKEEFTIKGSLPGAADSTKVYLQTLGENWKDKVAIDTAFVVNGMFEFKGLAVEGPKIHFIALAEPTEKIDKPVLVIVEPGKIEVNMDSVSTIKGTASNDKHQAFNTKMKEIDSEMSAIYEKAQSDTTKSVQEELEKQMKEKEDQMTKEIFDYSKANIQYQIGVYTFVSNSYMFSLDQTKELLASVKPEYKSNERIANLEKRVSALEATEVGKTFTDVKGKTPEGKDASLSDYAGKGKYVLVDFWASWCPPCRAEMPRLVEAYNLYKGKDFEIVGISLDKDEAAWKAGIAKLGITWPQISDLKYWDSQLSAVYGISSIPHTVLLDKEGKIIARGLHGEELTSKLAELLKD